MNRMSQDSQSSVTMKSKTTVPKPSAIEEGEHDVSAGASSCRGKHFVMDMSKISSKEMKQSQKSKMKNSITTSEINDEKQTISSEYLKGSRKGDPRMNKAVQAKDADPSLSLLDALLIGGFKFPGYDKSNKNGMEKITEQEIYDENGITMRQRKNQLGRRLRSLRSHQQQQQQEENEKQFSRTNESTNEQQGSLNHSSSHPIDLSRAMGEMQNHFLPENMSQMPSQFSSIENGLLQALVASSSSSHEQQQYAAANKGFAQHENAYPALNSLMRPHFSTLPYPESFSRGRYNQSVYSQVAPSSQNQAVPPSQVLSNAFSSDSLPSQQSLSLLQSTLTNPSSWQPTSRPASSTTIPSTTYTTMNQQREEELQKHLLLLLKQEYIHKLAQGQDNQRNDHRNQELQKIIASANAPTSNTFIANDLVQNQMHTALDSTDTIRRASFPPNNIENIDNRETVVTVVEDDSSSSYKSQKRKHRSSSQTKPKKHKKNETAVTPNSSPRFLNAMKTFQDKFDAFTHRCMEEAGYTKDESLELLQMFQKEVIKKTRRGRK